jgi:hypothetical protein
MKFMAAEGTIVGMGFHSLLLCDGVFVLLIVLSGYIMSGKDILQICK